MKRREIRVSQIAKVIMWGFRGKVVLNAPETPCHAAEKSQGEGKKFMKGKPYRIVDVPWGDGLEDGERSQS